MNMSQDNNERLHHGAFSPHTAFDGTVVSTGTARVFTHRDAGVSKLDQLVGRPVLGLVRHWNPLAVAGRVAKVGVLSLQRISRRAGTHVSDEGRSVRPPVAHLDAAPAIQRVSLVLRVIASASGIVERLYRPQGVWLLGQAMRRLPRREQIALETSATARRSSLKAPTINLGVLPAIAAAEPQGVPRGRDTLNAAHNSKPTVFHANSIYGLCHG